MDPRTTPFNGRVAHSALEGLVAADRFVDGETIRVSQPTAQLCNEPKGARQRQLLFGSPFRVLDHDKGWLWGFSEVDGYVGWVEPENLMAKFTPTHRVQARLTCANATHGLKSGGKYSVLSLGSLVEVLEERDGWSRIVWLRGTVPQDRWVSSIHLRPLQDFECDPAAVAERLTGTPYLWGGNSALGIDCSGLVQAALHACDISCPGDSDLQRVAFEPTAGADLRRGDLVFWKGHVAMMLDLNRIIHANAYHMSTAVEAFRDARDRINQREFGEVLGYGRPNRPRGSTSAQVHEAPV